MAKIEKQDYSIDIKLSQWKTCVEMANAVSARRDSMNNLFVTVNLAVAAAVSYMWDIKTIFLLFAGIIDCVVWILFINNYKHLNSAKFEVINSIEKSLPIKAFSKEWEIIHKSKTYKESTKLEKALPIAFIVLYVGIFLYLFLQKTGKGELP